MVLISSRPRSSFLRRWLTCMSIERSNGVALRLYMLSISMSRDTTRPAWRISTSRMSNSSVVSLNRLSVDQNLAPSRVQHHAVHFDSAAGGLRFNAPEDGADTRREFARIEGFRQVVVGAEFQPDDAVHIFSACGQHQHRHTAVLAQPLQKFETVHSAAS